METTDGKPEVKLNVESFNNMVKMMKSPDKENTTLALQCVENVNTKENLVYILLLLKHGSLSAEEWVADAPKTYTHLTTLGYKVGQAMTFKRMFETIMKTDPTEEDVQFFFDMFTHFLMENVKDMGCTTIMEMKMNIKFD